MCVCVQSTLRGHCYTSCIYFDEMMTRSSSPFLLSAYVWWIVWCIRDDSTVGGRRGRGWFDWLCVWGCAVLKLCFSMFGIGIFRGVEGGWARSVLFCRDIWEVDERMSGGGSGWLFRGTVVWKSDV